jgi:hypothetical protein
MRSRRGGLLVLIAVACGSRPPGPATREVPATAVLPDVPFAQLDHDQRIQFMRERVVPAMAPVFQQHDAAKYAGFTCATCHGASADDGSYAMPNARLPRLDLAALDRYSPDDVAWMAQQVKPAMAKLLREPEWSSDNPLGFGCSRCHPIPQR